MRCSRTWSVLENVMYGLRMSGVAQDTARSRAVEALRNVGLVGYDDRLPSELSGGQQQRVALARALVLEPAVLLFDEPLSNLDARLRREMREEIRTLQQRLQLTVAYVTHDQSEALAVSDQIIVMDHGLIAQRGTPQDLYEYPQSEFVAGFMGEAMLFPATADADGHVTLGPLTLKARRAVAPGAVKAAVRPEAWLIHRDGTGLGWYLRQNGLSGQRV
jgi:iron(III) transport system ATP-binding protein